MSRLIRWVARGYLVLAGVVIAGLLSEGVFRVWCVRDVVPKDETAFREMVWRHQEVDLPALSPAPPGVVRILGIADSFGVCGVTENVFRRLEQHVQAAVPDQTVEVVNISMPGYSLEAERRLLDAFGMRFSPALVIQGIFVGNDLFPEREFQFRGVTVPLHSWDPANLRSWALVEWGKRRLRVARAEWYGRQNVTPLDKGWPRPMDQGMFEASIRPHQRSYDLRYEDSRAWRTTQQQLRETRDLVRRHGGTYVMVVFPDRTQVEDEWRSWVIRNARRKGWDADLSLPQRLLRQFALDEDILLVDVLGSFQEQGREGGLYLTQDLHWNRHGADLAARLTAAALTTTALIPHPPGD